MRFDFATSRHILFGRGTVQEVPDAAAALGARVLLVSGRNQERSEPLAESLRKAGLVVARLAIAGEPTVAAACAGARLARSESCRVVVAMGGGSAIDAGKAIAALATNKGDPLDYLEVIGRGQPLKEPSLPCIAIPTTAGTGSEVTRNAVLAAPEQRVKVSLRSPNLLPRLAVVDPELTLDAPPAVTASTGLDALTQLIEPYVSLRANPLTDLFCLEGVRLVARSLIDAVRDGRDLEARTDMAMASLLGGLALANAGLGVVHGFAAPIGGMFPAPHGATCAALLPFGMEVNLRALRLRPSEVNALLRFETLAQVLNADKYARPEQAVAWVARACRQLEIPGLRAYGVTEKDLPEIVEKASRANSMKANPIALSTEELTDVVFHAL